MIDSVDVYYGDGNWIAVLAGEPKPWWFKGQMFEKQNLSSAKQIEQWEKEGLTFDKFAMPIVKASFPQVTDDLVSVQPLARRIGVVNGLQGLTAWST